MIKKILTTKAYLVVFLLGVINAILTVMSWGSIDLNRTIGWGGDISKRFWYYEWYLNFIWVIIFTITYWVFERNNYVFIFPIILLQIIVVVLLLFSHRIDSEFHYYLEITNWLLFFINIITARVQKRVI